VTQVTPDRRVCPDDRWVTPCITASASPPLVGLIAELTAMSNQRGEALPARLTAPAGRDVPDVADFLLLRTTSRWQKLAHRADAPRVHPVKLYGALVRMAGEFATFTETTAIGIRPLPIAPRQTPLHAGASYFELDRNNPQWQQMRSSGGFAIHVSGEFPDLRLEAIRG
jgi:predicted component of type VI protein secretion system